VSSKVDEPRVEEEEEEKDHGGLLHNYCPTAGDNERRLAAELARDSLCALVPCKEMARGSGALGSCTEEARDSVVALWSAAWNSRVGAFRKSNRLDTTTAWTQQPPGHNNRLDTEVRDLFRERMGNAV